VNSSGLVVRLVAGGRRLGCAGTAGQRKILALIERADAALVKASFLDLQIGAIQGIRRQFLDGEAHCFGSSAESPIGEARSLLLADRGRKQFGSSVEAEGTHGQGPLIFVGREFL
jgi:hypothetical protein